MIKNRSNCTTYNVLEFLDNIMPRSGFDYEFYGRRPSLFWFTDDLREEWFRYIHGKNNLVQ